VLTNTEDMVRTVIGSPYYLSPEIFDNKAYDFKADIWSLGIVIYEVCALKPPFKANNI